MMFCAMIVVVLYVQFVFRINYLDQICLMYEVFLYHHDVASDIVQFPMLYDTDQTLVM